MAKGKYTVTARYKKKLAKDIYRKPSNTSQRAQYGKE